MPPTPRGASGRLSPRLRPTAAVLALVVAAAVPAGCGGAPPPGAGVSRGAMPSLDGRRVLVFPVQRDLGVDGDATAEMAFALEGAGAGPDWLLPEELRGVVARNPAMNAPLDDLPVDIFLRAEVERVGDPLYGVLRRIGAVTDAELALVPVAVRPGPAAVDAAGAPTGGPVAIEFVAALLDVRTGRVIWFGAEAGRPGVPGDPGRLASAAEALARRLVPPPPPRRDAPGSPS